MSRLTRRLESGTADCAYCTTEFAENKYTENGNSYCSGECELKQAQLEKLARYEDLEERGLLAKLPCKIGEYVYIIAERNMGRSSCWDKNGDCDLYEQDIELYSPYIKRYACKKIDNGCPKAVIPVKVEAFEMFDGEIQPCTSDYGENIPIENYYTTKEAAEKALAEMEVGNV